MMRDHPIDVVMTDLSMQPLDGIDFVRLLRNSPDSPNQIAPVIMITGHSTFARVNEARDAGVCEFLAKPLTARGRDRAAAPERSSIRALCPDRRLLRPRPPPAQRPGLSRAPSPRERTWRQQTG